jgi:hypothetical protein
MNRILILLTALHVRRHGGPPGGGQGRVDLYRENNYIAPETIQRSEDFCNCEGVQNKA